jgi:mono/diheme cytochrome c family protein
MLLSHGGSRIAVALVSCAVLTAFTSAASANAIETASDARLPSTNAPIILVQATSAKVSYSNEQAKRGEAQYKETCVDCHGDDLRGGLNGGPPLRGSMFTMHFGGSPASNLFLFMSTQMPPEAPGRFSSSTYADLMAYVLQVNGFDAGAPLPTDSAKLNDYVIEK